MTSVIREEDRLPGVWVWVWVRGGGAGTDPENRDEMAQPRAKPFQVEIFQP